MNSCLWANPDQPREFLPQVNSGGRRINSSRILLVRNFIKWKEPTLGFLLLPKLLRERPFQLPG